MMQAAISTGAHWLERVVTMPAIKGSIAALASCNSSTLPAKISSGRWRQQMQDAGGFRIRLGADDRAMGLVGIDFAVGKSVTAR